MITAYLDETQQTESSKHVVVAGFCGTEDQWNTFCMAWKKGLGRRKSLHMRSLRWNAPRAKEKIKPLLARLGPIPYDCGLVPVVGSVRIADYHDLICNEPLFEQKMKGYHLCLGAVLCILMSRYPANERINIVCEAQAQERYWELAQGVFRTIRRTCGPGHPYFQSISNVYKGQTSLTQPADFLAFSVAKVLDEKGSKKDYWSRPIHPEGRSLLSPWTFPMGRSKAREVVRQIKSNVRNARLAAWQDLLKRVSSGKH